MSKRFDTQLWGKCGGRCALPTTCKRSPASPETDGNLSRARGHWGTYGSDHPGTGGRVEQEAPTAFAGDTTKATLNLDDFTQALVRRKLLGNDKYVSGIESGTEVFKGTGRLDTKAYSVSIG
ncbi:hypothetical protein [Streptomyces sp. HUAS ZL42]|uniref:hypothetical protein n=1 Tax=Streptomyces sp. HUAS ZL42 TaxID=3231715 RepID=UPI00345ECF90